MKKSKKILMTVLSSMTMLGMVSGCSTQGPKGDKGEQGAAGLNGSDGKDGKDGIDGKDGSKIYTGIGAPSSDKGKEGDLYIDTETGDMYYKGAVSWTKTGNIKGQNGSNGTNGANGENGVSILGVSKTSSSDGVDTYTITYSDGHTSQFTVTNGKDGKDGATGAQGVPGKDGHTPTVTIGKNGNWFVDGADTGVKAQGVKGDPGKDGITYVPCIFQNWDGSKLFEFYYERGSTVVYTGPTPTRPSEKDGEEDVNWTFKGWDKSLENIQVPTIFTAQYECLYTCKFVNYDGSLLYETKVNRGEDATYVGETPTKPSETNGSGSVDYVFKCWDKPLSNIRKDTTFTAVYDAPNAFECTFLNYDGTLLSKSYCSVGGTAVFNGATPTKASESDGSGTITKYEFSGWDKSLKNIKGDTTFTAQFTSTPYYECKFVNYDGTLLYKTDAFKGGTVTYEGSTPEKEQDAQGTSITDYTFSGWDKSLGNVQGPTTFTAQYMSKSFTGYKVTFKDNIGSTLYSHYYEAGKTAKYPFAQPWSYDSVNVHLFAGWSGSLKNLSKETEVTLITKTITREQNGEYPQAIVTDESLISSLSKITQTDLQGYVTHNGTRYLIKNGTYYRVEPIQWRWLDTKDDGKPMYVSEKCLDSHKYDSNSNNYKNSSIRKWLNGDFLDKAFSDDSLIAMTEVDNSTASTCEDTNPYVCENTNDKIFLLSRQEMRNEDYFADNVSRVCYGTEYCGTGPRYNYYWTRSPYSSYSGSAWPIYADGHLSNNGVGVLSGNGVRPALCFDLSGVNND